MKAIILAGGKGTRLKEVINNIPKPMASVAGKPFLEYLILLLAKWDIREIILSIGYKGEVIKSYFENGKQWGVKIAYSTEKEPSGTGGAVKRAARLIADDNFVAMNGDSFLDMDFKKIISYHKKQKAITTIGLVSVDDVGRYGKVEISERGEVVGFIEKKSSGPGLINGGVYVFNRKVIDGIPDGMVSLETVVLPRLITKGLYGMAVNGFFVDIGLPQEYLALCRNPAQLFDTLAHLPQLRKTFQQK